MEPLEQENPDTVLRSIQELSESPKTNGGMDIQVSQPLYSMT